jgi:alpha-tubulin suppressor-like RCC1 family protein
MAVAVAVLTTTAVLTPAQASIGSGDQSACATKAGVLYCWGANLKGQLGLGDTITRHAPTQVGTATNWTSVNGGFFHMCAIKSKTLWCWGQNDYGELGQGTTSTAASSTTLRVGTAADWKQVSAGGSTTCGLRGKKLWCWGRNFNYMVGPTDLGTEVTTPTPIRRDVNWKHVSVGISHVCAIRTNKRLYCWGSNTWGAVGDGTTTVVSAPKRIGSSRWLDVGTGYGVTCGVKTNKTGWCWGYGGSGHLTGSYDNALTPRQVPGTWRTIHIGQTATCGIKRDRSLWCWGSNNAGQLGNGTTISSLTPVHVALPAGAKSVSLGFHHTCAETMTREVYCWGSDSTGQIGNGTATSTQVLTPTRVL